MNIQAFSAEQLIGKTLQGYAIGQLLESSKLNAVYVVQQEASQRLALLSAFFLPDNFSLDATIRFRSRFTQIANKLAKLEHPHILPIYTYGEDYSYSYLITPSLTTHSIAHLLQQQGPLKPERALEFLQQVAAALDYAHLNGIIHGSLKSANILLDSEENVQIAQFGLMDMLSLRGIEVSEQPYGYLLSVAGTFLGAPEYMAPELVKGAIPDERSDVYALGMMLYEWLSGKLPFTDEDPFAVAFQYIEQPLPPLTTLTQTLSGALDLIIQRALDANPEQRYQTARKLVEACERALGVIEEVDAQPEQTYSSQPAFLNLPPRSERKGVREDSSKSGSYRRGLLSGTTGSHRVSDMPTIPFIPPHEERSDESGGWQLRPPIITNQMAAIRLSTGSQPPVSGYPPLSALKTSGSLEKRHMPLSRIIEQNNAPIDRVNDEIANVEMMNRVKSFSRRSEPGDTLIDPYALMASTNAMAGKQPVLPSMPNSYKPTSRTSGKVNKGRRQTLAVLATGGVAALGLLGLGGIGLTHLMQKKQSATTESIATPAMQRQQNQASSAVPPTSTTKPQPKKSNVLGQKSQPVNSAINFVNPADQEASLLIHLPDGNFVAYERACTHQQVQVNYDQQQHVLICPRHNSIFDPAAGAKILSGPAPTPLKPVGLHINADGSITTL